MTIISKRTRTIAVFCLTFFSITIQLTAAAQAAMPDHHQGTPQMTNHQAVIAATDNFYRALNIMFTGDGQPMKDAWSKSKDITYMGPSGRYLVGWDAIEKEWNAQTASKLGGKVTAEQVNTIVGSDLALINCIEKGVNVVNGKTETVQLRSSTVFRQEQGVWKVIAHQTDLLGYMNPVK